jgi:hypothetical protein
MNTTLLINRIKNILLTPAKEWDSIASESATIQDLFKNYIAPLALIGPVANFLGTLMFGVSILHRGPSFFSLLVIAVISYGLNLVAVFLTSMVINELAPHFSGTKNPVQALKAIAYSSTPGWLAGIFLLIPFLGIFSALAGIYGLYLLYLGLPKLMKVPDEKAIIYTVIVVVIAIVLFIITGLLTGWLMLLLRAF